MSYTKTLRRALVAGGILSLIEAAGLSFQLGPFVAIMPLGNVSPVGLYLSAYLAAIGASLVWIGLSGALGAAVAGAYALTVTYTGLAISLFVLPLGSSHSHLNAAAFLCLVAAIISAGIGRWFRRFPTWDVRPLNRLVFSSFVGFALLLTLVGSAVLLRMPNVFPMPLNPVAGALVGCSFLGSATYFLYCLAFPVWHNAYAQLWGFLAYDVVLIVPFVLRVGTSDSAHLPSLLINTAVLVYSGAIAIYFLFINRATRVWVLHTSRAGSKIASSRRRKVRRALTLRSDTASSAYN
jgi:hypothetical protein